MSSNQQVQLDPRQPLPRSQCEECGCEIIFVRTLLKKSKPGHPELGNPTPIEADPVDPRDPRGSLARVNPRLVNGRIDVVRVVCKLDEAPKTLEEERWAYPRLYVSHFSTCPQAKHFRGRKKDRSLGPRPEPLPEDGA